jgi:hypothetical protein
LWHQRVGREGQEIWYLDIYGMNVARETGERVNDMKIAYVYNPMPRIRSNDCV